MKIGDILHVTGCVTKEKFVAGRQLAEVERILGFRTGRLMEGIAVAALIELPTTDEFELGAYSNVATHRHEKPEDLDIARIKADVRATWVTYGWERLIKVFPAIRHDPAMNPDLQYPPGLGAPQWILTKAMRAKVVAVVGSYPNGRYVAADAAHR